MPRAFSSPPSPGRRPTPLPPPPPDDDERGDYGRGGWRGEQTRHVRLLFVPLNHIVIKYLLLSFVRLQGPSHRFVVVVVVADIVRGGGARIELGARGEERAEGGPITIAESVIISWSGWGGRPPKSPPPAMAAPSAAVVAIVSCMSSVESFFPGGISSVFCCCELVDPSSSQQPQQQYHGGGDPSLRSLLPLPDDGHNSVPPTTLSSAPDENFRPNSLDLISSSSSSCHLFFSPRPPPSSLLVSSVVAPDPDDDNDDDEDAVSAASTATTTAARVCHLQDWASRCPFIILPSSLSSLMSSSSLQYSANRSKALGQP